MSGAITVLPLYASMARRGITSDVLRVYDERKSDAFNLIFVVVILFGI
jgi:hypothetical protein